MTDRSNYQPPTLGWLFAHGDKILLYRCTQHVGDLLYQPWWGVVAHPVFVGNYQCDECSEER